MAEKGILLGTDGDLMIANGGLVIGDSAMQEVVVILQMNQGEQKFVPVLGANLVQLSKTKAKRFDIENRVKVHLALDDKDYAQVKEQLNIYTK